MQLTSAEKLIVSLLCDLRKNPKPEDSDFDYELIERALSTDNTWAITWEYGGALSEKDDDPDHVTEVSKALTMWRMIENSIAALSAGDRDKLQEEYSADDLTFQGFDANDEGKHWSAATMMISLPGRFDEFKDRYVNSHCAVLERYSRMHSTFLSLFPPYSMRLMTADELRKVLDA